MNSSKDPRKILAVNAAELSKRAHGKPNKTRFGKDTGISQGGAQRVFGAETDIDLGTLGKIAKWGHVEPWQLLLPGMTFEPRKVELSPAERDLLMAFRDIPEDSQKELLVDVMAQAERYRRHVEKILAEKFGNKGFVTADRAAQAIPPPPPPKPTRRS